jgi:hypothetical protein
MVVALAAFQSHLAGPEWFRCVVSPISVILGSIHCWSSAGTSSAALQNGAGPIPVQYQPTSICTMWCESHPGPLRTGPDHNRSPCICDASPCICGSHPRPEMPGPILVRYVASPISVKHWSTHCWSRMGLVPSQANISPPLAGPEWGWSRPDPIVGVGDMAP